jgi:two-component system response regulator HydG
LDEVAELPQTLQVELARAVQERIVGGFRSPTPLPFGSRVIASANCDPEVIIRQGKLRKDLYFRLSVFSIAIPPLRERKTDIPVLVEHILRKLPRSRRSGKNVRWTVSIEVLDRLLDYDWPGNVRELANCLEAAATFSSGPVIEVQDLPESVVSYLPGPIVPLKEVERQAIQRALVAARGDKLAAARSLGIGKTTMYRKIQRYRLDC